ncbi:MAG TPA: GNAT family N-acetyltransferase [Baekduia sp.]|nr:GNAT family N-acetyltransferase [Baekduia sp.]
MNDAVHLRPWGPADRDLLATLNSDPVQMEHVGGAETAAKIAERQERYARDPHQLVIVAGGESAGWVGFWEREWRDEQGADELVYEIGWSVLPAFQGRGLATRGTLLAVEVAREAGGAGAIHAFPGVDNAASNAVCRRAGFTLSEAGRAITFDYPPGSTIVCNDWRLTL